jgi:tetratricopeptide (TPR) repeat protein
MNAFQDIRDLWAAEKFDEALTKIDELLIRYPDSPSLLVSRGMAIQLLDHQHGPPLGEAERSFLRALEVDPNSLRAIENLAHYYDAVADDPVKAKHFAREYISRVEPALEEMRSILRD